MKRLFHVMSTGHALLAMSAVIGLGVMPLQAGAVSRSRANVGNANIVFQSATLSPAHFRGRD